MINYKLTLNMGCEGFNEKPTITANEQPEPMTSAQLAREMHHQNALIPEQVAKDVIDNLGAVMAQSIAEGKRIQIMNGKDVFISVYADIHLRRTFDLAEAQRRGFQGAALTEEAAQLINASDIVVKAKAKVEQKFTDAVRKHADGLQRTGIATKEYVRKKNTADTPATPNTNTGNNTGNNTTPTPGGNTTPGGSGSMTEEG